jgi:hypothetical protein
MSRFATSETPSFFHIFVLISLTESVHVHRIRIAILVDMRFRNESAVSSSAVGFLMLPLGDGLSSEPIGVKLGCSSNPLVKGVRNRLLLVNLLS